MKSMNLMTSITAQLLVGVTAILWQPTMALAGFPADDGQAQAQMMLSPAIARSNGRREPDRIAQAGGHLVETGDSHSLAQRLLLGINMRNSDGDVPSPPVGHRSFAVSAACDA